MQVVFRGIPVSELQEEPPMNDSGVLRPAANDRDRMGVCRLLLFSRVAPMCLSRCLCVSCTVFARLPARSAAMGDETALVSAPGYVPYDYGEVDRV